MAIDPQASIVKAYARLKGLRANILDKEYWAPRILVDDFNRAIDDMKDASFDLSDFAIAARDLEVPAMLGESSRTARSSVLKARIDAVLVYFEVQGGKTPVRVGFEAPKSK
jgi:hypothetical protein